MNGGCKFCLWKEKPFNCAGCVYKPLQVPPPERRKPPLGARPRYIHEELRRRELREAIAGYMQDGLEVNPEWVSEYNELVRRLKEVGNNG